MSEDVADRVAVATEAGDEGPGGDAEGEETRATGALKGSVRNLSFSSRLALAAMAVTILSLIVTAAVGLTSGEELADEVVQERLESQLALEADQVERFLASTKNQVAAMAGGAALGEVAQRFVSAFDELESSDDTAPGAARARVSGFYRDVFVPELNERTGGGPQWPELLPEEDAAIVLQDLYVVSEDPGSVDASLRTTAGDDSTWSEVHAQTHGGILELIDRLGVEDLYLIDPESGSVVYSAAKRPDFATNLDSGPYSGSHLASLMRTVRENPRPGTAVVSDIAAYVPELGGPAGFVAAPIFDGDRFVAILVVDLPVDTLNSITTSGEEWEESGMGDTGESFILGSDGRMRTDARLFLEDPATYVEQVDMAGTATNEELRAMIGVGTTITFQKVIDPVSLGERAETSDVTIESSNYLGQETFSSYEPLDIDNVDWYVATQMGRDEFEAGQIRFRRNLLIAVAVFVIVIAFGIAAWARGVFAPIRALGNQLLLIHRGETSEPIELPKRTAREFAVLAQHVDQMLDATQSRQEELSVTSSRKLETLRSLLPTSVAERVEAGDREMLDHVPQASLAVLVLHGIGTLVHDAEPTRGREELDDLIAHVDDAARRHGVEPVRLVGDTYLFGCGLNQPFLDHAPRTLAFALEARELVRDVAEKAELEASLGIHTGPVSVGLAGSSHLVYDVWGDTVEFASSLARSARPDEVLISDSTRSMLPRDVETSRWSGAASSEPVWEVVEAGVEEGVSG